MAAHLLDVAQRFGPLIRIDGNVNVHELPRVRKRRDAAGTEVGAELVDQETKRGATRTTTSDEKESTHVQSSLGCIS